MTTTPSDDDITTTTATTVLPTTARTEPMLCPIPAAGHRPVLDG